MEANPIHSNILALKSKKKFSLYNTTNKSVLSEVTIDEKDPVSDYCLASNKNNQIYLVYSTSSGFLNIYSTHDLEVVFSKKIFNEGLKRIVGIEGFILLLSNKNTYNLFNLNSMDISQQGSFEKEYNIGLISVDSKGHNIAFTSKNKVYIHDLSNGQSSLILTLNESINYLRFSEDGRHIVLNSNMHFVNIYSLNGECVAMLQLSSSIAGVKVIQISSHKGNGKEKKNKGKKISNSDNYICLCYNPSSVFGYEFTVSTDTKNTAIISKLSYEVNTKNIINLGLSSISSGNIDIIYGDLARINQKEVSIISNSKLKEGNIRIKAIEAKDQYVEEESTAEDQNCKIIPDVEIHSNGLINMLENSEFKIVNDNSKLANLKKKTALEGQKAVTLLDSLNSALANNDNEKFDWVITQQINVEPTVKAFNPVHIDAFLSKAIERFNTQNQTFIVIWLETIFRCHYNRLPVNQLKQLEGLILSKTMNYQLLIETESKIELLSELSKIELPKKEHKKKKNNELQPKLVYYESEDEEEKGKKEKYSNTLKTATTIDKHKQKKNKANSQKQPDMDIDFEEDDNFDDDEDAFENEENDAEDNEDFEDDEEFEEIDE